VQDAALLAVVALSSVAAYLIGTRGLGLSRRDLGAAIRVTLEAVGLGVLFLVANLPLAALTVALARAAVGRFVSVYSIDDLALTVASLLQGIVFRWWLARR
jgi:hypothetical protein